MCLLFSDSLPKWPCDLYYSFSPNAKVSNCELDGDRPVEPPRLLRTEVLLNPFDDLTPRPRPSPAPAPAPAPAVAPPPQKRNLAVLSFVGEEEEEEEGVQV